MGQGQPGGPNQSGKTQGALADANQGSPADPNRRPKSNENYFGVPPNLTESSHKTGEGADFVDEEEEEEAQNNIITQAELFKSYAE